MSTKPTGNLVKWWPSISDEPTANETALHTRMLYNTANDHDQAITLLKGQIDDIVSGARTSITNFVSSGASPAPPAPPNPFPGLGAVNNQSGMTAYTVQSSDNGALVILSDASPIAVTLNSALTTPYFVTLSNQGAGTSTVTPSTGLVNGGASLDIPGGSWATFYFDGVNWEAESPGSTVGGVSQIVAGSNVTVSPAGGVGVVTVSASGGGGGPTVTTNANGTCVDFGGAWVHQFGTAGPSATGVARTSFFVTFPVTFANVPVVVCEPANDPDAYGTSVFSSYPSGISIFGFTANLTCGTTIGGGGPANITVATYVNWMADYA